MIQFSADLDLIIAEAGDENRPARIAGIAVPWDVVATVSGGQRVKILRGAFDLTQKPAKLLENHDMSQLRGIVNSISDSEAGLEFEATLADTRASKDAIALLKAGAYDSVSVGANPVQFKYDKAGVMVVSKAQLIELSLVAVPAWEQAQITEIAASADPEDDENNQPIDTPQEDQVSEQIKAEAPESVTTPTTPIIYAQARAEYKLPTAAEYIAAQLAGGSVASEFNAKLRAAAPNVVTSDLDGILPTPIVQPVLNSLIGRRPLIDALSIKAMPQGGKIFIRPSVNAGGHTTIGASNGENQPLDAGTFVVTDNPVTKQVFGGYVQVSEEAMDWSTPEVTGLIIDDMARVYAQQTEAYIESEFSSAIVQTEALTNVADPAVWVSWIYACSQTILSNTTQLPTQLYLSPDAWAALGSLSDTADRPLFPQVGPMNAYGNVTPGTLVGNAFGLQVVLCPSLTGFYAVGNPMGFEVFEQAKGAISVDAADGSLSRFIKFRGYIAGLAIQPSMFVTTA
jgi:HK97 family phage prohead protease